MLDLVTRTAFVDEMVKIAQDQNPDMSMPEDKVMNKEVLKRFLLDAGAVALGTGAGYGLGRATLDLMKKHHPPKWTRPLILAAGPLLGATGAMIYQSKVKDVQNRRLAEAYRLGQAGKE